MNKTYLNYNSVEDVPLLNSRAVFQVNSSAVFREQGDITPTIIDKQTAYMPWGGDNQMPYLVLIASFAFCYVCCDKVCKNLNKGIKNRKSLHFAIKKLQNVMIITKNVLSLSS